MPHYRYISHVADFELSRIIPGRTEVLNFGDRFESAAIVSASVIELDDAVEAPVDEEAEGN